jgi:hypothetical protein
MEWTMVLALSYLQYMKLHFFWSEEHHKFSFGKCGAFRPSNILRYKFHNGHLFLSFVEEHKFYSDHGRPKFLQEEKQPMGQGHLCPWTQLGLIWQFFVLGKIQLLVEHRNHRLQS